MSQINYEAYRLGTKDGEIKFGHMSDDGQIYSVFLNNYWTEENHYIAMCQTGQGDWQVNSTLCRSSGSFAVVAGDAAGDGTPSIDLTANSGDIIINAKNGRIKLCAKDIELIAGAGSGDRGNIRLKSNEKITLDAGQMVDIHGKVSVKIVSDKDVETIGKKIVNIIGNDVNLVEGADVAAVMFGKERKGGDRVARRQASQSLI